MPQAPNPNSYIPGYLNRDIAGEMADSLQRNAAQGAASTLARSNATQDALGSIAAAAQGVLAAREENQQRQRLNAQDTAFQRALAASNETGQPLGQMDFVRIYGPQRGLDLFKAYHSSLDPQKQLSAEEVSAFGAASPEVFASVFPGLRQRSSIPLPDDPAQAHALLKSMRAKPAEPVAVDTVDEQGRPIRKFVTPNAGDSYLKPGEAPKRYEVTVPGPNGQPVKKLVTEEELSRGVNEYRAPAAPRAEEPLVAIMDPKTGQPVLVPRSQAVNQRPASNREQGRPVVSGDANRIADLDTSLNDLAVLSQEVTGNDATGVEAQIGAALPNWVTSTTGIGVDAKKKQAVIDRVKQVIGKALEGGVLRKEDEYKYEKILPTIGDAPEIVRAKLDGLSKAIAQRRQTTLDALADANFDVSKYQQRTPSQPMVGDKKTFPNGRVGVFDGKGWVAQ